MKLFRALVIVFLAMLLLVRSSSMTSFAVSSNFASNSGDTSIVNPAWTFQESNYGRNLTGAYRDGAINETYDANYNGTSEIYSVSFSGMNNPQEVISTKSGDTFVVSRPGINGSSNVVQRIVSNTPDVSSLTYPSGSSDWQIGVQNRDGTSATIEGAEVFYEYSGGTFSCDYCSNLLAMWLGFDTNTGYFFQVDAAWGSVNCLEWATGAPIFSFGYGNNLSNCPDGTATEGDTYLMAIFYDYQVTDDWWIIVYDESTATSVLGEYFSGDGTYISLNNLGLILESNSNSIGGPQIPNGEQTFVDPQYWDSSGNYYYWTSTPYYYDNSAPDNLAIDLTWYSYGIGDVEFTCSSC